MDLRWISTFCWTFYFLSYRDCIKCDENIKIITCASKKKTGLKTWY